VRAPDRRITGATTGKNRTGNRTIAPVSGERIASLGFPPSQQSAMARVDQANSFAATLHAPKAKRARSGGLQTRKCHSPLTAMRLWRRKCKRNSIYPHYSGGRRSWPIDASRHKSGGSASPWITACAGNGGIEIRERPLIYMKFWHACCTGVAQRAS
jgi:hypothetical protein